MSSVDSDADFYSLGRGLYSDLNVAPECSYDDLRQSYQRLILIYHPDKSHLSTDSTQFMKIHNAWRVLSDKTLRKEYDRFLLQASSSSSLSSSILINAVMLSDFMIIYDDKNNNSIQYKKQCRCGGYYIITRSDIDEGYNTVQCDNCSLELTILV